MNVRGQKIMTKAEYTKKINSVYLFKIFTLFLVKILQAPKSFKVKNLRRWNHCSWNCSERRKELLPWKSNKIFGRLTPDWSISDLGRRLISFVNDYANDACISSHCSISTWSVPEEFSSPLPPAETPDTRSLRPCGDETTCVRICICNQPPGSVLSVLCTFLGLQMIAGLRET